MSNFRQKYLKLQAEGWRTASQIIKEDHPRMDFNQSFTRLPTKTGAIDSFGLESDKVYSPDSSTLGTLIKPNSITRSLIKITFNKRVKDTAEADQVNLQDVCDEMKKLKPSSPDCWMGDSMIICARKPIGVSNTSSMTMVFLDNGDAIAFRRYGLQTYYRNIDGTIQGNTGSDFTCWGYEALAKLVSGCKVTQITRLDSPCVKDRKSTKETILRLL